MNKHNYNNSHNNPLLNLNTIAQFIVGGSYHHDEQRSSILEIMSSKSKGYLVKNFRDIIGSPDEYPEYDIVDVLQMFPYILEFQVKTFEEQEILVHTAIIEADDLLIATYGEKKLFVKKLT